LCLDTYYDMIDVLNSFFVPVYELCQGRI